MSLNRVKLFLYCYQFDLHMRGALNDRVYWFVSQFYVGAYHSDKTNRFNKRGGPFKKLIHGVVKARATYYIDKSRLNEACMRRKSNNHWLG